MSYDFCVIGGGIVGLATARRLLEARPGASLVILEKEPGPARHQTGHNSGVIHAGVYYQPGSLKAELCRRGSQATKEFAAEHGIPFDVCGKLIVATNQAELGRMAALQERATRNHLDIQRLDRAELRRREPNVAGVGALFVTTTGIVDYRAVAGAMADVVRDRGGELEFGVQVTGIAESGDTVHVDAGERRFTARRLVVCGGLQADRLARMAGLRPDFRIVPFRGEYFRLAPRRDQLVRHLIYPVPDPALPFLGVHLTRKIDGGITAGPNAVLSLAREGYPKLSLTARDVRDYASFPGLWRFARENLRTGARELANSLSKRGYLRECRKYCPSLTVDDLRPEPAGIRAQVVRRDGRLVDDFLFLQTERSLHVCNAPSPAATSAIPIAELIVEKLLSVSRR